MILLLQVKLLIAMINSYVDVVDSDLRNILNYMVAVLFMILSMMSYKFTPCMIQKVNYFFHLQVNFFEMFIYLELFYIFLIVAFLNNGFMSVVMNI